jgi:hypothetical protein
MNAVSPILSSSWTPTAIFTLVIATHKVETTDCTTQSRCLGIHRSRHGLPTRPLPLTVGKKRLDPTHELLAVHYIDSYVCQRNTVAIDVAKGEEIGGNLAIGL